MSLRRPGWCAGVAGMQTHPPTQNVSGRLLSAGEVAEVLGVAQSFVYALVRRGELPAVRVGERYVRFRSEALHDWIANHESSQARWSR